MDINAYLAQYPEAKGRGFLGAMRPHSIRNGVLQFTPETADRWAGPLPGGFASFDLWDCRLDGHPLPTEEAVREHLRREVAKRLRTESDKRTRKYLESGDFERNNLAETTVLERPFRLWFLGTDDTSYSKWYATIEEATAELDMLLSCAPVDFHKDFLPLGFVFTN